MSAALTLEEAITSCAPGPDPPATATGATRQQLRTGLTGTSSAAWIRSSRLPRKYTPLMHAAETAPRLPSARPGLRRWMPGRRPGRRNRFPEHDVGVDRKVQEEVTTPSRSVPSFSWLRPPFALDA